MKSDIELFTQYLRILKKGFQKEVDRRKRKNIPFETLGNEFTLAGLNDLAKLSFYLMKCTNNKIAISFLHTALKPFNVLHPSVYRELSKLLRTLETEGK